MAANIDEIMGRSDGTRLIEDDDDGDESTPVAAAAAGGGRCGRWWRRGVCGCKHKRLACFLSMLAVILLGHGLVIYFLYFNQYTTCDPANCLSMRILSLNTWGMPERLGSKDKAQRMAGIARLLSKAEYDLYLFEELWMRPDYYEIQAGHFFYCHHFSEYVYQQQILEYIQKHEFSEI